jgi:hypothetical protein
MAVLQDNATGATFRLMKGAPQVGRPRILAAAFKVSVSFGCMQAESPRLRTAGL